MNRRYKAHLVAAAVTVVLLGATSAHGEDSAPAGAPSGSVVLELFTSQGCSSCPPADALLRKLSEEPEWQGRLVALGYHVDSWNYVGWTDPFSTADWTDRQVAYAKQVSAGRTYTPQAIINGKFSAVGSDERSIRKQLADAAAQPAGKVALKLTRDGRKVTVELSTTPPSGHAERLDLMLAVVESGLVTDVAHGENAHRTLHDDYVVRRLQRAAKVAGADKTTSLNVHLERDWKPENVRFAAFLQDPDTRAIYGAASAAVPQ